MNNSSSVIHKKILLTTSSIILFFSFCLSLMVGNYKISFFQFLNMLKDVEINRSEIETYINIIVKIRLPRTLASLIIGGALSVAGTTYQSIFRNNLASHDILGVSTGSCVGASLSIIGGFSPFCTQLFAFIFGILTVVLTYAISMVFKKSKSLSLLLSGIIARGFMASVFGLIKYLANPETQLLDIVFWTMGDVSAVNLEQLIYVVVPIFVCALLIFTRSWKLNFFGMDSNEAVGLGINIKFETLFFIILSTILVASSVSLCGSIDWIGLVIPIVSRLLIGENNKFSVPLSFLIGASFLILVDVLNRIISTAEIPLSILTGLIGVPLFVFCILISKREKNDI